MVLSDETKRREYDQFGRRARGNGPATGMGRAAYGMGPRGGFDGDMFGEGGITPEQLFAQMFGGGGFPGGGGIRMRTFTTPNRRGTAYGAAGMDAGGGEPFQRRAAPGMAGARATDDGAARRRTGGAPDVCAAIFQLLPMLLLFLFLFLNPFSAASRPLYHLSAVAPYTAARQTAALAVPYYVEPAYDRRLATMPADVVRLDREVENDYLSRLDQKCQRERRVASAQTRGRTVGAAPPPTEACETLEDLLKRRRAAQ
jgi:hypothetical protein